MFASLVIEKAGVPSMVECLLAGRQALGVPFPSFTDNTIPLSLYCPSIQPMFHSPSDLTVILIFKFNSLFIGLRHHCGTVEWHRRMIR